MWQRSQLSLRGSGRWKSVELYERESRLLRGLSHPSIPAFVDAFEVDTPTDRVYVLVQQLAPGETLQALVDGGTWRPDEAEIERIAGALLDVLTYLHSRRPPVIHRDIKPSNVLYEPRTGVVSLVDFGAVRETLMDGSTQIGTFGYMAPEQFLGKASPASDLYSLGAVLLLLLSGRAPAELPQRGLRVDWERAVVVGPRLRALLSALLEPDPEARVGDARRAAALLRGEAPVEPRGLTRAAPAAGGRVRRPAGTRVVVSRDGASSLVVDVPPAGMTGSTLAVGGFAATWLGIVGLWTASAVTGGAPLLFTAFSAPFWAVGAKLAKDAVAPAVVATTLTLTPASWRLEARAAGKLLSAVEGATADLDGAAVATAAVVNDGAQAAILDVVLSEGVRAHRFGAGLQRAELEWVAAEVNAFLAEARAAGGRLLEGRE